MPTLALAQGQQGSGSPYSAYGFGDLLGSGQVVRRGMGGVGVAHNDPFGMDPTNPASYSSLARPAFEAGLAVHNVRSEGEGISSTGRRTDLLGMSLGIPFGRGKWGVAVGLNPYSAVGYRISTTAPLPGGEGDVRYIYSGDGGLNKVFAGVSKAFEGKRDSLGNGNRFSVGLNYEHLFGSIRSLRQAIYGQQGYYNSAAERSLYLRDGTLVLGAQFQGTLIPRRTRESSAWRYLIGARAELGTDLRVEYRELVNSFVFSTIGTEIPFDTSYFEVDENGSLELPMAWAVGLGFANAHWTISAEHRRRAWGEARLNGEQRGDLGDLAVYAVGASFRPAGDIGGSFWERTIYRAGLRSVSDYLVVNGQQLSQIGMSFGMSLPVMGSSTRSRLNLGVELGERGELSDGLLRERYADVFIGITITPDLREQWFKKRRIE